MTFCIAYDSTTWQELTPLGAAHRRANNGDSPFSDERTEIITGKWDTIGQKTFFSPLKSGHFQSRVYKLVLKALGQTWLIAYTFRHDGMIMHRTQT